MYRDQPSLLILNINKVTEHIHVYVCISPLSKKGNYGPTIYIGDQGNMRPVDGKGGPIDGFEGG